MGITSEGIIIGSGLSNNKDNDASRMANNITKFLKSSETVLLNLGMANIGCFNISYDALKVTERSANEALSDIRSMINCSEDKKDYMKQVFEQAINRIDLDGTADNPEQFLMDIEAMYNELSAGVMQLDPKVKEMIRKANSEKR